MADSCSYVLGTREIIDDICFKGFRKATETDYLIIEPEKQFYPLEYIEEYFDDLREMGFEFTHVVNEDDSIHVFVPTEQDMGYAPRMMLVMAIRYLWEGQYTETMDKYYHIINTYTELKQYKYMSKYNKLQIMCIAHNLGYIIANNTSESRWYSWNSNHSWTYLRSCKLKDTLPNKDIKNVNEYMSMANPIEDVTINKITEQNVKKIVERMYI